MEFRSLPVPDGLDGTRVDAALAKMLGFSRTFAADVISAGGVSLDGVVLDKSDRLHGGSWLEVEWEPKQGPTVVPIAVPDLGIVYDDDDIVVVDKPTGVAAHPSLGWEGPTVVGALVAAGFRVSTSGAAERQGIVHRLDVGTSGLMVVAKTERAYTVLKRAFKERTVEKIYHTVVQGHPDPLVGTIDAPIGRHPNHSEPAAAFARLHGYAQRLRAVAPEASWISAGMTGDFAEAIAAGATHLRIGSAITGPRPAQG